MTKKEIEKLKKVDEAYTRHNKTKEALKNIRANFLIVGCQLYLIWKNKDYLKLNYQSMNAYLAQDEICLSPSRARDLIGIYRKYIIELKYNPKKLVGIPTSKLSAAITLDEEELDELWPSIQLLSLSDLRRRVEEIKTGYTTEWYDEKNPNEETVDPINNVDSSDKPTKDVADKEKYIKLLEEENNRLKNENKKLKTEVKNLNIELKKLKEKRSRSKANHEKRKKIFELYKDLYLSFYKETSHTKQMSISGNVKAIDNIAMNDKITIDDIEEAFGFIKNNPNHLKLKWIVENLSPMILQSRIVGILNIIETGAVDEGL